MSKIRLSLWLMKRTRCMRPSFRPGQADGWMEKEWYSKTGWKAGITAKDRTEHEGFVIPFLSEPSCPSRLAFAERFDDRGRLGERRVQLRRIFAAGLGHVRPAAAR